MMKILVYCIVFIFAIDSTSAAEDFEKCTTPKNRRGVCKPIGDCEPIVKLLNIENRTVEENNLLRHSLCKQNGRVRHVCCPAVDQFKESDLPQPGQCGTQIKERILGGTQTSIVDFPWFALINYAEADQKEKFYCGGALISDQYVVTAAHCAHRKPPKSVRLGEHDINIKPQDCSEGTCADPVEDVLISNATLHESYNPRLRDFDIALLRLERPIKYTDWIRPVCLPFDAQLKNKNFDSSPLIVTGFGKTENSTGSNVKLKLEIKGANLDYCQRKYDENYPLYRNSRLSSRHLCAGGEEGHDSCNGDSGGPLMAECIEGLVPYAYLAGIVSFGPVPCGQKDVPGVYTRVDQFLDWILDNMSA